ncbi:uncharacterized protein LKV04_001417 isoform 2-T2 [Tautogolabrus adspersus]
MQVVSGRKSFWIYTLLLSFQHFWGRLSASTSSPTLPAPKLDIHLRTEGSVVLVCRASQGHRGVLFMLYKYREMVDSRGVQSGAEEVQFTVRVQDGDPGQHELFCCLFKDQVGRYSAFSPYLQLEPQKDVLPLPTLVLQQQTDVWHLLCRGSPAYPGGLFSLYLADHELPVAVQHANFIHHQVTFPVPVQDTPLALYQCQYSVLLGKTWSNSERSLSLAVSRGLPPPSSSGVDWPLILGCFSAVVLFLCSLALVVIVAHRKVKAAAEEKKKREEAHFWTQVHSKDHVVDLTLRRRSFTSQEWTSADTTTEGGSRSPLWNSMSTFTSPIHQIH